MRPPTMTTTETAIGLLISLLIFLLFASLPAFCCGQTIEGPFPFGSDKAVETLQVGQPAWLRIISVPPGASIGIEKSDVLDMGRDVQPLSILFFSREPGTFTVRGYVNASGYSCMLTKQIVVAGQPEKKKAVRPSNKEKWQLKIFVDDPMQVEAIDEKFRESLDAKGHILLGVYDVSTAAIARWPVEGQCFLDAKGRKTCPIPVPSPPEDVGRIWWEHVRGDPMPRVAAAPRDGGDIQDFPLPGTVEELFSQLDQWGK